MESLTFQLATGVRLSALDWGGRGPLVLMAHGTGFCAGVFDQVARHLSGRARVVAYDARGHGDSDKPADGYCWRAFRDDLLDLAPRVAEHCGVGRVELAVGHSLGGAVTLMAAQRAPGLFGRLLLMEPILVRRAAIEAAGVDPDQPPPMALAAQRRRAALPSIERARESLRASAAFAEVTPACLEDYLRFGYEHLPDGRLRLKCPPAIEAATFAIGAVDEMFDDTRLELPVLLQRGERGWLPAVLFESFLSWMPRAELVEVPAGHLIPMERPEATAEAIARWLSHR